MTGEKLLKKLSILCYILGIVGIIIGIIAMNTNLGDTLFEGYMENNQIQSTAGVDAKTIAGISFIMSCIFTLFEGWLLGRAAKDGRKTTFLIILLILGIISPIIEICSAGFNSILNMESIANIIGILIKAFILNQTIKVRREALDD
ncbi:MAG: hypothetical protein U0L98_00240 [Clostridia bacterium]|nr:hypothetical protein [Clostridia bacterium]